MSNIYVVLAFVALVGLLYSMYSNMSTLKKLNYDLEARVFALQGTLDKTRQDVLEAGKRSSELQIKLNLELAKNKDWGDEEVPAGIRDILSTSL